MDAPDVAGEIQQYIRGRVAEGFTPPATVVADAVKSLQSPTIDAKAIEPLARLALAQVLDDRRREQANWPAITDCDRLDAAFEELNVQGIMARHNWWCCTNCGKSAMPDEFDRLDGAIDGKPIIGYTFYHEQDTEAAAAGGGIYLCYCSTERAPNEETYDAQTLRLAQRIGSVLKSHGLPVDWDGTIDRKIGVPLTWQRRARPARFCED